MNEHIKTAVDLLGGQSALAEACGVQQGHVWYWLHKARSFSVRVASKIEEVTEGKVLKGDLIPELRDDDKEDAA